MGTMKKKKGNLKQYIPLYLMMIPGLTYLIVNNYIPMAGLVIAFKKFSYADGIWGSKFNGITNFKFLFTGKDSYIILRNTLLYNLAFIVLGTIISITVAIMLNAVVQKKLKKMYQTVILVPYLISIVVVSYMSFAFLGQENGFINNTLVSVFGKEPIAWYSEPKYWPFILILIYLWKNVGYTSVLYYTTLIGIDPSLYEAATMDGASGWQKIKYITLPCLRPTIITMVLMSIGRIFYSDFGLFYQVPMNAGPLFDATNTIDTYVYRALTTLNDVGRSSAAGFMQSICGFIVVFLANLIVSKTDPDNALF